MSWKASPGGGTSGTTCFTCCPGDPAPDKRRKMDGWMDGWILEAQTNIPAVLGQDVILPCKVPNNNNIGAVEWIRPDQDPEYVLFYRDGHLVPENQHPSYQNRVDLQDKDMKDGDFSLILNNAMKIDTGRYVCRVFEEGKIDPISNISLVVHLPGEKLEGDQDGIIRDGGDMNGILVGSAVIVILLLAVLVSVVFLIYRRHMNKNPNLQVPLDDPAAIEMLQQFPDQHQQQPQLV